MHWHKIITTEMVFRKKIAKRINASEESFWNIIIISWTGKNSMHNVVCRRLHSGSMGLSLLLLEEKKRANDNKYAQVYLKCREKWSLKNKSIVIFCVHVSFEWRWQLYFIRNNKSSLSSWIFSNTYSLLRYGSTKSFS